MVAAKKRGSSSRLVLAASFFFLNSCVCNFSFFFTSRSFHLPHFKCEVNYYVIIVVIIRVLSF